MASSVHMIVVRISSQTTNVRFPYTIPGNIRALRLVSYIMAANAGDEGPFFLVKFGQGIAPSCLTCGTGLRDDCLVVPWQISTTPNGVSQPPKCFQISTPRKFPNAFTIELFKSTGAPFTPTECVLWFEADIENAYGGQ